LDKQTLRKVWILRRMIGSSKDKQDALEYIINGMKKTENNEQFLELMKNE